MTEKQRCLENLLSAGARLANLCYNLRQDERISAHHQELMGECQTIWDKARDRYNEYKPKRRARKRT